MDYNYERMELPASVSDSLSSLRQLGPNSRRHNRSRHIYSTYVPNARFSRYNDALATLKPIRFRNKSAELSVAKAGLFSFATCCWVLPHIWHLLRKKPLDSVCPQRDSGSRNASRIDGILQDGVIARGTTAPVFNVYFHFVKTRTFISLAICFIATVGFIAVPYVFGLRFLCVAVAIAVLLRCTSEAVCLPTALRLCAGVTCSILCHSHNFTSGVANAILKKTVQDNRCLRLTLVFHEALSAFVTLFLCGLTVFVCGWVRALFLVLILGLGALGALTAGLLCGELKKGASIWSDKQTVLWNEFLEFSDHARYIGREKYVLDKITEARREELSNLRLAKLCGHIAAISIDAQILLGLIVLCTAPGPRAPIQLISTSAVVLVTLAHYALKNILTWTTLCPAALDFLDRWKHLWQSSSEERVEKPPPGFDVCLTAASFSPRMNKVDLEVKCGSKVGICGADHCGKTTLILGCLGCIPQNVGKKQITDSFALLTSTIEPLSVKDNILSGSKEDARQYKHVCDACGLQDIPDAISCAKLSAAQRARVSLARLLYSDVDLYVLDEPASDLAMIALEFLQDKSVLVATNCRDVLQKCDRVYFMTDGYIFAEGTHQELSRVPDYLNVLDSYGRCSNDSVTGETIVDATADISGTQSLARGSYVQFHSDDSVDLAGAQRGARSTCSPARRWMALCTLIQFLAAGYAVLPVLLLFFLREIYRLEHLQFALYLGIPGAIPIVASVLYYLLTKIGTTQALQTHKKIIERVSSTPIHLIKPKEIIAEALNNIDTHAYTNTIFEVFICCLSAAILFVVSPWLLVTTTPFLLLAWFLALIFQLAHNKIDGHASEIVGAIENWTETVLESNELLQTNPRAAEIILERTYSEVDALTVYKHVKFASVAWLRLTMGLLAAVAMAVSITTVTLTGNDMALVVTLLCIWRLFGVGNEVYGTKVDGSKVVSGVGLPDFDEDWPRGVPLDLEVHKLTELRVREGEKVAILGLGVEFRADFLKFLSGASRFGGVAMGRVPPRKLRECIGYVPRTPQLFAEKGTVVQDFLKGENAVQVARDLGLKLDDCVGTLNVRNLRLLCAARARLCTCPLVVVDGPLQCNQNLDSLFPRASVLLMVDHVRDAMDCDKVLQLRNGMWVVTENPQIPETSL